MRLRHPVVLASLIGAVGSLSVDFGPAGGFLGVAPAAAANVFINVIDNAVTLTPTAADYTRDYVEITGASGLRIEVKTNSPTGLVVYFKCVDAAPRIALNDFLVRTMTPPATGGTSLTTYTAVTSTDQALWSSGIALGPFTQINLDLRIRNLFAYADGVGGATTGYTDNLSFTVISQ